MTHNAKAELGGRIREARASKGWKQRELASEVEVEPITVSRWERGATTPDIDDPDSHRGSNGGPERDRTVIIDPTKLQ